MIAVKHNIEVAHRLFETPGKCENIHGHSMWVTLYLEGEMSPTGMEGGADFADLKKAFRKHLDTMYDHRVLLNQADPFAGPVRLSLDESPPLWLPGLQATAGDPTTENIARWVLVHMRDTLMEWEIEPVKCEVWETAVNMASAT